MAEALGNSIKTKKEKVGEFLADYTGAIGALAQFIGASMDGVEKAGNKLKNTSIEKVKSRVDDLII